MQLSDKLGAFAANIDDDEEQEMLMLPGSTRDDARDLRLGFLVHDVSRLRRTVFDQLMKPLAVTRSQWWVIAHLSREDGMMQTKLAEVLDIGKVTLGGLVDRLEVSGWVKRRADASDRRVKRVFLTPAAYALIRQMRIAERKHNSAVLDGLSSEDRDLLIDLLQRIKSNLRDVMTTNAAELADT